jgi:hypothetical protein
VKSEYYGGYPAGYLRRVRALFPEKRKVLHIFSGKVDTDALPGDTVDINPDLKPTYVDDAQTSGSVPLETYDLVMADTPYSVEDAERYQTTMVKRNTVMRACATTRCDRNPHRLAGSGSPDVQERCLRDRRRDRHG